MHKQLKIKDEDIRLRDRPKKRCLNAASSAVTGSEV